tara:strand:- start:7 stop:858 length:852 start_codon:yes stop_codon:yes gene_type:complete
LNSENIISEILEGVSPFTVNGETFFFKHPTIKEKLKDHKINTESEAEGKKRGIKTEEELIDQAIRSGSWSKENEDKIEDLQWLVEKTESSISKLSDPNLVKHNEKTVDGYKKELSSLELDRSKITYMSLENYALSRSHKICCERDCYYLDNNKKKSLKTTSDNNILGGYIQTYGRLLKKDNLIKAAYTPVYFDLVYMATSPLELYPEGLETITVFQKDLLFYAHILCSKLKNLDIPDGIRNDAIAIFDYKPKEESENKKEDFNPRKFVESKGGLEKMKPEDKL